MKTRFYITFYYVVTSLLAALGIIIVLKLLFYNPCTPTGSHGSVCTIDGWSIAGLAATVLGVAAAILAILGAFAVAYWWAELDKRVKKQVETLFDLQKAAINKQVDDLLEAQRRKIESQTEQIAQSKRELEQVRDQADSIIDLMFSIAFVNPPWMLESWARDITNRFRTPEAAKHMVFSYLEIVQGFISTQPAELTSFLQQISQQNAPSTNLSYYWQKAQEWEQVVIEYYKGVEGEAVFASNGKTFVLQEPQPKRQVKEKMDEYRMKLQMKKSEQ